ncbi:MAG: hypothetical protein HRT90_10340 [Candidatus Margulisbacteria bacterium]|nr:hypothetical protein [Candidatus Margulisiibacteriota bacterium]
MNIKPDGILTKLIPKDIRKVNKLPLLIVLGVVVGVMITFLITVHKRSAHSQISTNSESNISVHSSEDIALSLFEDIPDSLVTVEENSKQMPIKEDNTKFVSPHIRTPLIDNHNPYAHEEIERLEIVSKEDEELRRIRQKKQDLFEGALNASSRISAKAHTTNQGEKLGNTNGIPDPRDRFADTLRNTLASARSSLGQDQNMQSDKMAFLEKDRSGSYLNHTRQKALSPYEIKSGTIIPSIMISGINSDLPGQIIAQISQNVFDTATGQHLIIPQGSKLYGVYDSQVSYGQNRVLAAWNRIIFPDASTLELGNMQGVSSSGYSGFNDRVNNHYFKIFGNAFLLSLITAGFQMSQPQDDSPYLGAQDELAAALGQQLNQVGMEVTRKNMQVQPTLKIRPGYRFNVIVNKDILFERPYGI